MVVPALAATALSTIAAAAPALAATTTATATAWVTATVSATAATAAAGVAAAARLLHARHFLALLRRRFPVHFLALRTRRLLAHGRLALEGLVRRPAGVAGRRTLVSARRFHAGLLTGLLHPRLPLRLLDARRLHSRLFDLL